MLYFIIEKYSKHVVKEQARLLLLKKFSWRTKKKEYVLTFYYTNFLYYFFVLRYRSVSVSHYCPSRSENAAAAET